MDLAAVWGLTRLDKEKGCLQGGFFRVAFCFG